MVKNKKYPSGFTLIEMLVVVLIIGILAGIALPQYQMAVTKAKVASILPIMRRWYDASAEWRLMNGNYCKDSECTEWPPDGSDLGVSWPSDWKDLDGNACDDNAYCENDYWTCDANDGGEGEINCHHYTSDGGFNIQMYQPDYGTEDYRGRRFCSVDMNSTEGHKVCKALGGKLIAGYDDTYAF